MNKSRVLVPALAMLFLAACAATHAEVHWVNVPEEKDLVRYAKKP